MTETKRPNFLIILADDLGYSDVGCFGGEIKTPNIDRLAGEGVRFTDFHTASACSPTRSMLMSGTDNHLAGVGAMVEHMASELGGDQWRGQPGHEGYLNEKVAALPEVLRDAGYHTIMSGKWHLGREPQQFPASRGFDRNFSFMWGCHNHYAYEPQWQAQGPGTLGNWVPGMVTKERMYTEGAEYIPIEANFPIKADGFYSTDTFTTRMIDFLAERDRSPELKSKPFMGYLAFTAPHWPLQAPKAVIDHYKGMYDAGPHALREARLARQRELGLVNEGTKAHPLTNPFDEPAWDEMTAEQKKYSSRAMEAYAGMVELIDQNVGRVVDHLRKSGELDNTVVIFMSDNGAEGASYEAFPYLGTRITKTIKQYYNNSYDNIGEPDSFVWYGNHWAQAATAPSRLYKMWTSQGGIRVPFVMRYPPLTDRLGKGSHHEVFTTVMDIMPTFMDLAQAPYPRQDGQVGRWQGRQVYPFTGKTWVPWLHGKEDRVHEANKATGWELHGRAAIRKGNWKIIWLPPPQGKGDWELFDLSVDPGETNDLASRNPEKLAELKDDWDRYVADNQVIWAPGFEPYGKEADEMDDGKGWMPSSQGR